MKKGTPPPPHLRRRRLSTTQITCFVLLWFFLVYIVFTSAKRIDGPMVLSIIISGVIVAIPILREVKMRNADRNDTGSATHSDNKKGQS